MKYKAVMEAGDYETSNIEFKDYVFEISLMDMEDKANDLARGLKSRNDWVINGHAAAFQGYPFNMQPDMPFKESDTLINKWLDENDVSKMPSDEAAIAFVGDVLTQVLD